jgi:hypothetical protein
MEAAFDCGALRVPFADAFLILASIIPAGEVPGTEEPGLVSDPAFFTPRFSLGKCFFAPGWQSTCFLF